MKNWKAIKPKPTNQPCWLDLTPEICCVEDVQFPRIGQLVREDVLLESNKSSVVQRTTVNIEPDERKSQCHWSVM